MGQSLSDRPSTCICGAAASVGPVQGHAAWIGEPAAGLLRVVLRDPARGEAPTASALVRIEDAPAVR